MLSIPLYFAYLDSAIAASVVALSRISFWRSTLISCNGVVFIQSECKWSAVAHLRSSERPGSLHRRHAQSQDICDCFQVSWSSFLNSACPSQRFQSGFSSVQFAA
jgi:hypothetical protein